MWIQYPARLWLHGSPEDPGSEEARRAEAGETMQDCTRCERAAEEKPDHDSCWDDFQVNQINQKKFLTGNALCCTIYCTAKAFNFISYPTITTPPNHPPTYKLNLNQSQYLISGSCKSNSYKRIWSPGIGSLHIGQHIISCA